MHRKEETGDSGKEAPFASAGGVEGSEFLGGAGAGHFSTCILYYLIL